MYGYIYHISGVATSIFGVHKNEKNKNRPWLHGFTYVQVNRWFHYANLPISPSIKVYKDIICDIHTHIWSGFKHGRLYRPVWTRMADGNE